MARARPIPDLAAGDSYGEAAAKVIAVRADEVREHVRGVLDTSEIKAVHDMRVATRRLRAALEIFEPCFPRKLHRRTLKEVKRLARGLGERRDRDVAIAELRDFAEGMDAPDRVGVESLISRLRDEQAEANMRLAPLVDEEPLERLGRSIEELLAAAGGRDGNGTGGEAVGR